MADFYEVHGKQLDAACGKIRRGECWSVALLEPLVIADKPKDFDATITIVRFVAASDGTLKPATELDYAEIADWKRRHRSTPPDWFGLPRGLFTNA